MIKLALTIDVEPDTGKPNSYSNMTIAMPRLLDLAEKYEIPFTWFITHDHWGKIDEKFPPIVERMAKNGEIGCHVHFRNEKKKYYTDYGFQRELIATATEALRNKGGRVVSFRGGAFFFNEDTLRILEELSYEVDNSVMPGLYNKPVADLIVNHKQCITIKPYHPSRMNHCLSGDSPILEIPLSVYPRISFKTNLISLFLPSPLNLGSVITAPAESLNKIRRLSARDKDIYIVLSYHSWSLLSNLEGQLENLAKFFTESLSISRFFTLSQIRANLPKGYSNMENLKGSRIVITRSNFRNILRRIR